MHKRSSIWHRKDALDNRWLAAAVIGTYWGAFEIIIGSFLHNLRVPMSGTILSFFAVILLVAFHQLWHERGIFWRAGLVAALMKSIAPSAVILGPMTGILTEALFMELFVFLLGRNIAGYLFGGAFAIMSALLHKTVSLLILYGFDLVTLLTNMYAFAIKKLNIHEQLSSPWYAVALLTGIYLVTGATGALLGYFAGRKGIMASSPEQKDILSEKEMNLGESGEQKYSPVFLGLHLVIMIFLLWVINTQDLWISVIVVGLYIVITMLRYRRSTRHLKKPFFWIQLVLITLFAAIFWNGLQSGRYFDREGLSIGIMMNLRAFLVMVAFSAISVELRNPLVRIVLYRHGFARLYLALGLAFSALPLIAESFSRPGLILKSPMRMVTAILQNANALMLAFQQKLRQRPHVFLVTGAVGSGKTTFLTEMTKFLEQSHFKVCGFLAPGINENDRRKGYLLNSVPDNEKRRLSVTSGKKGKMGTGNYTFFPDTVRWGEKLLHPARCADFEIIVIDEVGPLELKGQGWARALGKLMALNGPVHIWSVRSSVVESVKATWMVDPEDVFLPEKDSPEEAAKKIATLLRRNQKAI